MKTTKKWSAVPLVVAALVLGLSLSGCATASSFGGTSDNHGLISSAKVVTEDAQEIASYKVILGLVDSGYADYITAVKKAESEGKTVTTVRKWLVFLTKTTAYVQ
jgi:hypothetical protein